MSNRSLRPYQIALTDAIRSAWAGGAQNVCAVLPTGGGKTVVFGKIIADYVGASVAIAHRNELVAQMSTALAREGVVHRIIGPETLRRECVRLHTDELGRSFYSPNARCAVAGANTLARAAADDPWFKQVGLWVIDETHHTLADNLWGRCAALFPNARGLGVTATPTRADGKGLGRHADGLMDVMVQGPAMRELIEQGYLTEYRIFAPPSDIDLSRVAISASGDYSPPQLRTARHQSHITGDVVAHYLRIAPGKLGVTFDVDVESATATAEAYRAAGVPAQVISGETPPLLRSDLLRQFRARKIHQIVSVDILGEGFDLPAIEVVSFARPTQSLAVHMQQFGRALRPLPGKTHAIIIDHVGNTLRHGLPDARREWTLDRRERRSAGPSDAIPVRTCLNVECLSVYERFHPCCPFCGHTPEPAQRSAPEFVDGDLCELDPAALAHMRGEVHRVMADMPTLIPQNVSGMARAGHLNRHLARRDAVRDLAETISLWAGWQRHLGRSDAESYRRFFHGFGTDMGTALTASAADAEALTTRIRAELERANVTSL